MKKIFITILISSIISILFLSCGNAKWLTSFEEAKKISAKKNQDIFMVVSGGEELSKNFKTNVLDSKEFLSSQKNLTLLFINLSADGLADLDHEQFTKVYEETSKIILNYNITDELTMIRMSPEGYCLFDFPYVEKYESVENLIEDIKSSEEKVGEMKSIISKIKKTSGTEKVRAIDQLYESTDENHRTVVLPLCNEILDLDKENATGLLGKYELISAYDQSYKILSRETVDQSAQIFINLVNNGHLDKSQKFEAYYTASFMYSLVGSMDFSKMIDLLEMACKENPSDKHFGDAQDLLQNLRDLKTVYESSQQNQLEENVEDNQTEDLQ